MEPPRYFTASSRADRQEAIQESLLNAMRSKSIALICRFSSFTDQLL
jgi:hypothetical protein